MSKSYGLIGEKLGHSFSKTYFSDKFRELKLANYTYDLFELDEIKELLPLIKKKQLNGLNVTVPYKELVIPLLDELSEDAKAIQAVNTIDITWKNNTPYLKGYNTDAFGFERMVKPFIKSHHERALILGTGGAAKAVQYILLKKGIETLFVSRNPSKKNQISYTDINEYVMNFHNLIINTTPVGMYPTTDYSPKIPYQHLTKKHTLIDLIYNPEITEFLAKGATHGCVVLNGIVMLHQQAEKAWEIWNK